MERQILSASNIVKAIVALLGLLPPLAVITGLIDIPPSLGQLVKIVTFPISVVAVVAIIANGHSIRQWSYNRAIIVFSFCALVGSTAAVSYYVFADRHVFKYNGVGIVTPLQPSVEVQGIIKPWSDRYDQALDNSPRSDRLRSLLRTESFSAVVIMILLMVVAQALLVVAMVGSAWKLVVGLGNRTELGG